MAGLRLLEGECQRSLGDGEVVPAEVELIRHVAFTGVDVLAVQIGFLPRAIQLLADARTPFVLEIGHVARHPGHGVDAPHRPVAPGRVEQPGGVSTLLIVVAAREQGHRLRVLLLRGEALRLGQGGLDRAGHVLGHSHPPGHRLRVAERDDPVRIVPGGFVVTFLEPEAEVLPALDGTDLGKRHPKSLLGDPALEALRKEVVVLSQSGPELAACESKAGICRNAGEPSVSRGPSQGRRPGTAPASRRCSRRGRRPAEPCRCRGRPPDPCIGDGSERIAG